MTRPAGRWAVPVVVVWALAIPLLTWWGLVLDARGEVVLSGRAVPFVGGLVADAGWGTVVAVLVGAAVVGWGPRVAQGWSWVALLLTAWATTTAWALALAASAGWSAVTAPLRGAHDYLAAVPGVAADPAGFLATLQDDPTAYPVHVRGHPPAFTLLLAGLDRVGLGGAGWAAGLVIVVGTSTVVAVALTLRALGGPSGEATARAALPAVVLAPAALWVATSADAFYAGVLAWGVALLALGTRRLSDPSGGRSVSGWVLVVAAGLVLGQVAFLSWGLLHMALVVLAVPVVTRAWRPTLVAGAVVLGCVAAWGVAGYWLWDGLAATHVAFTAGIADARPYLYFALADVVLLGVLVGPAGVGGLTRFRELDRATRWLAGLAVVTALAGALSGFERGEVERIWLPVACWVAPVAAALAGPRGAWSGSARWWLVAQAGCAILIETVVRTAW